MNWLLSQINLENGDFQSRVTPRADLWDYNGQLDDATLAELEWQLIQIQSEASDSLQGTQWDENGVAKVCTTDTNMLEE